MTNRNGNWLVVCLCGLVMVADGYDLGMYGTVVPSLLAYPSWSLSTTAAASFASLTLVGMIIGNIVVGPLVYAHGLRRLIIAGTLWFSLGMGCTAFAPTPEVFGILRFVSGLGFGGVMPLVITLSVEYAPRRRPQAANAVIFAGWAVGGTLAGLLGSQLVPEYGFRSMFLVGSLSVAMIPLLAAKLPESAVWLLGRGRRDEARKVADRFGTDLDQATTSDAAQSSGGRRALAELFRHRLLATILFGLISCFAVVLVYALQTWLPVLLLRQGQSLSSALLFLGVLNLGLIAGTLLAGYAGDRFSPRHTISVAFLLVAISILLLAIKLPPAAMYFVILLGGAGIASGGLNNGFVAGYYPAPVRPMAVSWSTLMARVGGIIGPLLGGVLLMPGQRPNLVYTALISVAGLGWASPRNVETSP